jgi:hypothetical protein
MRDISSNLISTISSNNLPTTFHGESINFFLAANITNTNQKVAVDNLVRDLKINNLWDKMIAIYPIVGGTSDAHKFNLKDPRDLDAAYRLIFSAITHSSGGISHTGSTGGANTNIRASNFSSITNNIHLSVYSRTDLNDTFGGSAGGIIGLNTSPGGFGLFIYPRYGSGGFSARLADNGTLTGPAMTTSLGFYLITRTSSASKTYFKNGVNLGTSAHTSFSLSSATSNIILGRNNIDPTSRQIAFASFGSGLTESEAIKFSEIVESYQYRLYRNVSLTI